VTDSAPTVAPSIGIAALHDLRDHRKHRRMGDVEWFDLAYRVYIVAIFGGGAFLWLSSLIGDDPLSAPSADEVLRNGPAVMGMVAVLVFMSGLRSGAQGGPLALETADVVHVMLAPVDRAHALRRPMVQRVRSVLFLGIALGALAGQLGAQRLPGSPGAWAAGGALYGVTLATLWAGGALLAHGVRLPLWAATTIGAVAIAWQGAALVWGIPGVADLDGGLALWGWRQRPIELLATAFAVGLLVAGIALAGRTSLEALNRRSALVSQLRFAVTMQDLRTVILLRRQLNHENTRRRPWVQLRRPGRWRVWRRGWYGLLRFPAVRLLRMGVTAVVSGVALGVMATGTTAALLVGMFALYLLGLEVLEPLSQEIDHNDRTDQLPIERGRLLLQHIAAPLAALVPFGLLAGGAAALTIAVTDGPPAPGAFAAVSILAVPVTLAGACGSIVSVVKDAPDPVSVANQEAYLPPEVAGFGTAIRTIWPLVVSTLGVLTTLVARAAHTAEPDDASAVIGGAVRGALAAALLLVTTLVWVQRRDRVRAWYRRFVDEGKSYTKQNWS
jgi:hypothetical protein